MNRHLDQPPTDESVRSADAAKAKAKAPSNPPTPMTKRDPAAPCAETETSGASDTRPMIKPSSHQKVAIGVHREDWP